MALMTKSDGMEDAPALSQEAVGHDGAEALDRIDKGHGRDRHDLVPILAFLRREIDGSAIILHDLAERISQALCTLGTTDEGSILSSSLFAATTALQNEDRIQQRLSDLVTALSVLEQALIDAPPATNADVDGAIFACLRLEETREAFATAVGMVDALPRSPDPASVPAVGDIDLF